MVNQLGFFYSIYTVFFSLKNNKLVITVVGHAWLANVETDKN